MVIGPIDPVQPTTAPDIVNPPTLPNTPERPAPSLGTTEDNWATWPTTEWPTTEWPTDNIGEMLEESAGKQFSRGYYVAIGLGALLVIVIILIVVGIVVYKMRQRKRQKGKALKESMDHCCIHVYVYEGVCLCVCVCVRSVRHVRDGCVAKVALQCTDVRPRMINKRDTLFPSSGDA